MKNSLTLLVFGLIAFARLIESKEDPNHCVTHLFPYTQYSKVFFHRCTYAEIAIQWNKWMDIFIDFDATKSNETRFKINVGGCELNVRSEYRCQRGWLLGIDGILQRDDHSMELQLHSNGHLHDYSRGTNVKCARGNVTIFQATDKTVWTTFRVDVPEHVHNFWMIVDGSYGAIRGEYSQRT